MARDGIEKRRNEHYEGKCIGGPNDGKTYACQWSFFAMDVNPQPYPCVRSMAEGPIKSLLLQRFTYRFLVLGDTGIWVPHDWDAAQAINHLVNAYKGTP